MPSNSRRIYHADFGGVNNTKAPHLIPNEQFVDLIGAFPKDGDLLQTQKFVKTYQIVQTRSNEPTPIKVFETVYDEITEEFFYLCVSESQAWLQSIDALKQTSGTPPITGLTNTWAALEEDGLTPATWDDLRNTTWEALETPAVNEQIEIPIMLKTLSVTADVEDQNSQCLVDGFNLANAATDFPNIGDTIEVEILSATTFSITSSVSGVLGTGLTIDREVPIPSTDYVVYFYNDSATQYDTYNVGDTWTYTRSELPRDATYNEAPWSVASYGYDVYFVCSDGSVLKFRDNVLRSVGYAEAIKGLHVHLFANKLFVSRYGLTNEDVYRLRWSEFDDPDLFYQDLVTEGAEAGENNFLYTFKGNQQIRGITGLSSYFNRMFIAFPSGIHIGTYIGGGITMQFEQLRVDLGTPFTQGFVAGHEGLYFIGQDLNVYTINSQDVTPIGYPIIDEFQEDIVPNTNSSFPKLWGFFNEKTEEVYWVYPRLNSSGGLQYRAVVYKEEEGNWFYRNFPSDITDSAATPVTSVGFLDDNSKRLLWGATNYIYRDYSSEDSRDQDVLADDIASSTEAIEVVPFDVIRVVPFGTIEITPETTPAAGIIIETKDFIYNPTHVAEVQDMFMDALWNRAENIEVFISARNLLSQDIVWKSLGTWTPENEDQHIDHVAEEGKCWRFKFIVNPKDGENLIDGFRFKGWAEDIYGIPNDQEQ